jgi:arylsulfatase
MIFRAFLLSLLLAPFVSAAEKPNIILIMSDDMGWSDIGCYGGEIKTPNLDALAKEGVRFTQFYNTGRCCPTRASLLTGLYPHQAGIGHMTGDYGLPSYRGDLNRECVTIAEALKPAGYRTYMAGKWHVTPYRGNELENPDRSNWPRQRGFDRFFGTIHGAGSFFDPNSLTRDNTYITPENDPEYQPDGTWYYTDAISDNTVRYIRDHAKSHPDQPFFHYVAYTAAHWPMHALPEDIARYEGKYDGGYLPTHQARIERLRKMKLLPEHWEPAPLVGNWEEVELKEWEAACMEVYAAMVDNMDQGIGRIVNALRETGQYENTLILFLQDNGGCAETFGRGKLIGPLERPEKPTLPPMGKDELQTEMVPPQSRDGYPLRRGDGVMPGPYPEVEIGYGKNWANVSNTPFREYKHYVHEGGISTPLIAHWPAGIAKEGPAFRGTNEGALHDAPSHLIDVLATAIDLAGADYPAKVGEHSIKPLEGVSLRSALQGKDIKRGNPIFFEHEGNRAVRDGEWKLVSKGVNSPWELYDMEEDRTEMNNLISEQPDIATRMIAQYDDWAQRAGVVPFGSWKKEKAASQTSFSLKSGDSLPGDQSPAIKDRPFEITAKVSGLPAEGVIASQGGSAMGWSLFIRDGKLQFATRNQKTVHLVSAPLPDGAAQEFQVTVTRDKLLLRADRKRIAVKPCAPLLKGHPIDGVEIGHDLGGTVADFGDRFSGTIEAVSIELK